MSETRVQFLSGIFKDDTLSTDKFNCLYYAYNSSRTAFVSKKSRFSTLEEADSYLTTYNATFLSNLSNDFDNVTVNSNSVSFTGTDYKFYNLDVTFSSSSADIDYTNILTSINTNLTNLNTNIINKDNQSDIVQVLKDSFIERVGARDLSVFKTGSNDDSVKGNAFIPVLLFKIAQLLSSDSNYTYNSTNLLANRALDNISKKLSAVVPDNTSITNTDIRRLLIALVNCFINRPMDAISDPCTYSFFRAISDKLANANDLHSISQAIDLISTAIAQTPTTDTTNLEQGLTEIKESIENKDNVLLVDGTQNFVFRKEEDDPDQ